MGKEGLEIFDYVQFYNKKERFNVTDGILKADKIVEFLIKKKIKTKSVIELGCGSGDVVKKVCSQFNAQGVGVDISRKAIVKTRESKPTNIEFIMADATKTPIKDKSFDLCLLIDIVEHILNPHEILNEALRVSKMALIKLPLEYNVWRRFLNTTSLFTWEDSRNTVGHLHWWNYEDALKILSQYNVIDSQLIFLITPVKINLRNLIRWVVTNLDKISFRILPESLYMKVWGGYLLVTLRERKTKSGNIS